MEQRSQRINILNSVFTAVTIVAVMAFVLQYFNETPYQESARNELENNLGDYFYLVGGFHENDILAEKFQLRHHPAIIRRDTLCDEIVVMAILGKYEMGYISANPIQTGTSTAQMEIRYVRVNETPFLNLWSDFRHHGKVPPLTKIETGDYIYADTIKYFASLNNNSPVRLSQYASPLPDSVLAYARTAKIRGNWDHVF